MMLSCQLGSISQRRDVGVISAKFWRAPPDRTSSLNLSTIAKAREESRGFGQLAKNRKKIFKLWNQLTTDRIMNRLGIWHVKVCEFVDIFCAHPSKRRPNGKQNQQIFTNPNMSNPKYANDSHRIHTGKRLEGRHGERESTAAR